MTVKILDDPRMSGTAWIPVAEVTQAMLDAWPVWERMNEHGQVFGHWTRPTLGIEHEGVSLRPLRMPGMNEHGVIKAPDMTAEHFARVAGDWHWRSNCSDGRWTPAGDDERPDKRLAPEEQWRPAIFASVSVEQTRFDADRLRVNLRAIAREHRKQASRLRACKGTREPERTGSILVAEAHEAAAALIEAGS